MSSVLLSDSGVPATASPLSHRPDIAHVVVGDSTLVPSDAEWLDWARRLRAAGYRGMRSGALSPRQQGPATRAGMVCIQELALLETHSPFSLAERSDRRRTHNLRRAHFERAAAVDRAAFGDEWCLDARSLAAIREATPAHRSRWTGSARAMTGFVVSGRGGPTGYVQRIAVLPSEHRRGIATALLDDALRWMRRRECTRVMVNTHVDNRPALALYEAFGFRERPERLRVMETTWA